MIEIKERVATAFASLLLVCTAYCAQQPATKGQDCAAPMYFGICDPYVPGTIIGMSPDGKAIEVFDTWPNGPAEESGICPGDQIVAVNRIPVPGHTWDEMLKQLVSPFPSPIDLKVMRDKQEMDFHFDRARESTLAQLSHQQFMLRRLLMDGLHPSAVPAGETPEEAEELGRFFDGVDRSVGFKFIDGLDVPEGTPEEQVRKLRATAWGGPEHGRWVGVTARAMRKNTYSPGFDAVVLKNPEEVLVNRVLPDSPAQRAGLFPGDQLLEVDGHAVSGLNEGQISDLILKPDEQREVILRVRRGQSTISPRIGTQKLQEIDDAAPYHSLSGYLGLEVVYVENPREAMVD
jgi:C-terminal processing protease CtpA/Prc